MEYFEITKTNSYKTYKEGNSNAHPSEKSLKQCGMFTVVYYAEPYE